MSRNKNQTCAFVIGHTEDFDNADEVVDYVAHRKHGAKRAALYTFEVPKKLDDSIVVLIGRGLAFSEGWERDTTYSCVVSVVKGGV